MTLHRTLHRTRKWHGVTGLRREVAARLPSTVLPSTGLFPTWALTTGFVTTWFPATGFVTTGGGGAAGFEDDRDAVRAARHHVDDQPHRSGRPDDRVGRPHHDRADRRLTARRDHRREG
ncbi:hypothetical protein F5972_17685 [Microbispora cellulosiformans]|uniref:Uncharacterized protein n=1 Tax=Microbispora cellulosiformans TaxID=2614688 RepID=A0A5J5K012_9ACTN|nr:hypothetical protein [Microbispora cellulosiformans]KAA9377472.1 hypothetical protein F5972_17685 [Microbispora cellulosiformans]